MIQELRTLVLQRTQVWLPAPIYWFTTVGNSGSRDLMPSFDPYGHQPCLWYTYIHAGNGTHTYKIKKFLFCKHKMIS